MTRRNPRVPSYRLHKPSGQAVVTLDGRDNYLGLHGTDGSKQKYARLIQEWLANHRTALPYGPPNAPAMDLTVNELVLAFWRHAKAYYVKNGEPTGEIQAIKYSLRPLVELYGDERASEFSPRKLKAVRQAMIDSSLARTLINRRINRVRHLFKWGVENELVPPAILDALRAVAPLKRGRCEARESAPVKPVEMRLVDAIEPHVSRQVWAMVQLQLRTAMRPGEVVIMRRVDLDTGGKVWTYVPASHKTEHHGHHRRIYLGPQAQSIILPFLRRLPGAYLFSPAEAEQERLAKLHRGRKTPRCCGNRPGTNRRRVPRRRPGSHYDVGSYRRAIQRGCDWAFPWPCLDGRMVKELSDDERAERAAWQREHRWHPHQLRHNAATFLRQEFGVEAARLILGHHSVAVAELYAELDHQKAVEIMASVG